MITTHDLPPPPGRDPAKRYRRAAGAGRPRHDDAALLAGVLHKLATGCTWAQVPQKYGSKSTLHRRYQQWREAGVFDRLPHKIHYIPKLSDCPIWIDDVGTYHMAVRHGQTTIYHTSGSQALIMDLLLRCSQHGMIYQTPRSDPTQIPTDAHTITELDLIRYYLQLDQQQQS